jgi:hypothetical protein
MRAILAGVVLGVALVVPQTSADATTGYPDPVFPRGLPMAASEDSCYVYRCVWDAKHQGNGRGLSMILTRYHGDFIPREITHRRAHRLIAAWCARPSVTCEGYGD